MAVFSIGKRYFNFTKEEVIKALEGVEPESLNDARKKYYIEVNKKRYPIKQVIAVMTGLPRVAFTAADAYRILTKLGFEVKVKEEI